MKKILFFLILICCTLGACSSDDSSEYPTFGGKELSQTTWKVLYYVYNEQDEIRYSEEFKIQFTNGNLAWYIDEHGVEKAEFKVDGRMFYCNRIPGHWTLLEKSKDRMVLQDYQPEKVVLILTRIL